MKKIIALALAVMMSLSLVCVASAEKTTYKVGILTPAATHGWVAGITYFAEQHAKQLAEAGTIEYKLSTSSNAEEMTTQIDEMSLWGAQALVIAPQWEGMEVPVQNAIAQGIVCVAFDMDIAAEGIYKVTGDNESMGVAGAKYIVEKIGTEGLVVAMPVPTAGSVNELRMKGFTETMKEIAPNVKIVEYANPNFTIQDGMTVMADVLTANAKIDAVFSLDDETSLGALKAMEDAGRTEIKAITGGGGCQDYFNAIVANKDQIAACSALYSPLMIKDCLDVAVAVLGGEEVEHVKVIPSQIVDATNADEYIDPNNTIY